MPEVTMTVEEYLALVNANSPSERKSAVGRRAKPAKPKRKGTPDPKMSKALQRANEIGRKKNGGYKKGYSQAKIMSLAHKLRRKM